MQTADSFEALMKITDNKIVIEDESSFSMTNSKVYVNGKNNILYCEENVRLVNSVLVFNADNSVIYLSKNNNDYYVDISVNNNCVFLSGENNYFNSVLRAICSEEKSVILGRNLVISRDVWIRTADPHLVYDSRTKERLNYSKSVFIGDHVWLGQSAIILKGTRICSGSIIGAGAVAAGKSIESNASYAGNPIRRISEDIFWDGACVHKWVKKETDWNRKYKGKKNCIYHKDNESLSFDSIDKKISECSNSDELLAYIKELNSIKAHNRFAGGSQQRKRRKQVWKRIKESFK